MPGDFGAAIEDYRKCLDLLPQHLAASYALAQCYVEKRLFSNAIKLLEKLTELPKLKHEPEVPKA